MAVITMRQMLEAGVHFGHQTRRWNPKMKRFIFGERNGIYIIDLDQTLHRVETAYDFVRDLSAKGGTVLFIGTKKQAQDPVRSYAEPSAACPTSTSAGSAACSPTSRPSPSASPRCRSTSACVPPASSRPCRRRKPSCSPVSSRSCRRTSAASAA